MDHRILQAQILEWVAISFSRGSSSPRDQTQVSCSVGRLLTIWTTREGSEILNVSFRTNFLYHRHKLGGLGSSSRGVFGVSHNPRKADLKLSIQKTKSMASGPIISWQIDEETVEMATDFKLSGSKITADGDYSHEIRRCLLLGKKGMTSLDSILKIKDITLPTMSI